MHGERMKRAPTLLGIGRNAFQSVDQFNVACCNRPLKMAIRLKAKKEEKREREREEEQRTRRNVLVFGYKCFSSISEHVTCVHNRSFIATLPFTFFLFFTSRPESVIFFFLPPPVSFRIYPARYAAVLREHGTFALRGYAASASTTPLFLF